MRGVEIGGHSRLLKHTATSWLVVCAVLLAGCETLAKLASPERHAPEPDATWQTHISAMSAFRTWALRGTLTVRADGESSRVRMQWRQAPDSYLLRFTGPLGVGLLEVVGGAAGVEARFPDGRRIRAASPEELLEAEIGWSVPLEGLRYWIVGVPAPDGTRARLKPDDQGRLARLEQAGWTVVYDQYVEHGDLVLPERIRFSSGSVDATVVVRQWKSELDLV